MNVIYATMKQFSFAKPHHLRDINAVFICKEIWQTLTYTIMPV